MLTLNDGRSELWQWDTKRKMTVDDECSQVHFSNKVFGRSIDMDVVDGVAEIPDILLQTDRDLIAWAFVGTAENGYTKISKVFKVNRRNKPADYVFTPPEQTTLAEIMERLDDLEAIQDPDSIKNAVDDYLENNPIKVEETDPTVPDWAKKKEKPKYTADEVGALSKTELSSAVNDALAQAKASGEFDGADGQPGEKGEKGEKGDPGAQGPQGADGNSGVWVDSEAPTDSSYTVWVDPAGNPSGDVGGATIMWENPNPTTRVDEGNGLPVEIDFSGYRTAQLICRKSANEDATFSTWLDPTKEGFVVPFDWTKFDEGTNKVVISSGTMEAWMDNGSLVFWGASIKEISIAPNDVPRCTNIFNGDYMIPQMIIGYK